MGMLTSLAFIVSFLFSTACLQPESELKVDYSNQNLSYENKKSLLVDPTLSFSLIHFPLEEQEDIRVYISPVCFLSEDNFSREECLDLSDDYSKVDIESSTFDLTGRVRHKRLQPVRKKVIQQNLHNSHKKNNFVELYNLKVSNEKVMFHELFLKTKEPKALDNLQGSIDDLIKASSPRFHSDGRLSSKYQSSLESSVKRGEENLKKIEISYKKLRPMRLKDGAFYKTSEMIDKYGIEFSNPNSAFSERVRWLEKNRDSYEMSLRSYDKSIAKIAAYKNNDGEFLYPEVLERLDGLRKLTKKAEEKNTDLLKNYSKASLAVSHVLTIKFAQLEGLKISHPDLKLRIEELVDSGDYKKLFNELEKGKNADIKKAMESKPLVLTARVISDSGMVAMVRGRPTKVLGLKAKSDPFGNIPVDQIFSPKVSSFDKIKFNEFSKQSLGRVTKDGLPTSISKPITKKMIINGEEVDFVRVKRNDIEDSEAEWINKEVYKNKTESEKELFSLYEVHSDPRSMKGGTESLLAEWGEKVGIIESEFPHYDIPQKPKDLPSDPVPTDKQIELYNKKIAQWSSKLEKAKVEIENNKTEHDNLILSAREKAKSYALFLVMKENPDLSDLDKIKSFVNEKFQTSGAIAPDLDPLSVGTTDLKGEFDKVKLDKNRGNLTPSARTLINLEGKSQEAMGQQRVLHHGGEERNWGFPQNLLNDYPISVFTSDGRFLTIPKGSDSNPHKNLFDYYKKMEAELGVELSVNPAYVFQNMAEFSSIPLENWPTGMQKSLALYKVDRLENLKSLNSKISQETVRLEKIELNEKLLNHTSSSSGGSKKKIADLKAEIDIIESNLEAFDETPVGERVKTILESPSD